VIAVSVRRCAAEGQAHRSVAAVADYMQMAGTVQSAGNSAESTDTRLNAPAAA